VVSVKYLPLGGNAVGRVVELLPSELELTRGVFGLDWGPSMCISSGCCLFVQE
jgi:hypothetical protein